MIRKQKLYSRPKKMYQLTRIKEENLLVKEYGLKNKREIWKTSAKVGYFRSRAKELAKASQEEQDVLFKKLQNLGLNTSTIADVLALTIKDLLQRRLQTIIFKKGFAKTTKQARQMITHKQVSINGCIVNSPSYLVPVKEEKAITAKVIKLHHKHKEHKSEEKSEEGELQ